MPFLDRSDAGRRLGEALRRRRLRQPVVLALPRGGLPVAAKVCTAHSDAQSKQLFESLIADEERHQDQYEKQMDNIRRFGPSYLALQAMGAPTDAPKGGGAE